MLTLTINGQARSLSGPLSVADLLTQLDHPARAALVAEVTDATVNLALAYALRPAIDARVSPVCSSRSAT